MKTKLIPLSAAALLRAALPLHADDSPATGPLQKDQKETHRKIVVMKHNGQENAKPRAWLGIEPAPVGEALAAQLNLPEGTGLLVAAVLPDSPAEAAGLRQHDVLTRLDDQVLIESRQLQVLVRSRQAGDTVKLTYLRGGREDTLTVTLAERLLPPPGRNPRMEWFGREGMPEVPPVPPIPDFEGEGPEAPRAPRPPGQFRFESSGLPPELVDEVMRALGEAAEHAGPALDEARKALRSVRTMTVMDLGEGELTINDGDHTLHLKGGRGERMLKVQDRKGNELFEGPVNTPAERDALPADIRHKLERLEREVRMDPAPAPEIERRIHVIRPEDVGQAL